MDDTRSCEIEELFKKYGAKSASLRKDGVWVVEGSSQFKGFFYLFLCAFSLYPGMRISIQQVITL
jgi:hypothetical protein